MDTHTRLVMVLVALLMLSSSFIVFSITQIGNRSTGEVSITGATIADDQTDSNTTTPTTAQNDGQRQPFRRWHKN